MSGIHIALAGLAGQVAGAVIVHWGAKQRRPGLAFTGIAVTLVSLLPVAAGTGQLEREAGRTPSVFGCSFTPKPR